MRLDSSRNSVRAHHCVLQQTLIVWIIALVGVLTSACSVQRLMAADELLAADKGAADAKVTPSAAAPALAAPAIPTTPPASTPPASTPPAITPLSPATPAAILPPVAAAAEVQSDKPLLTEVKPDLLYVRDEASGKLVPLIGMTLKEFTEQADKRAAMAKGSVKPAYGIESMTVQGTAHNEQVDLAVEMTLHLTVADWIRVPLHFNKSALRAPPKVSGDEEHLIQFDRGGDGYVIWLRGKANAESSTATPSSDDKQRTRFLPISLSLSLLATLPRGERRLELDLPEAASSRLDLDVPAKVLSAASSGGKSAEVSKMSAGKSEISVGDLKAGEFKLSWTEADVGTSNSTPLLDGNMAIYARCEPHSIKYDATIVVRTLRGPFDRFRVELPPQSTWLSDKQPADKQNGYSVAIVEGRDNPTVEFVLDRSYKEKEMVTVKLAAERAYDPKTIRTTGINLSGFTLLPDLAARPGEQSVKQSGCVGLAASDEMTLRWDRPGSALRQVDRFPDEKRRADLVAAFEFVGKPDLKIMPAIRNSKLTVEPEYIYVVERDKVRLEATWTYQIGRAKLNDLEFELPDAGWEGIEVGPANLVALDDVGPEGGLYRVRPLQKPADAGEEENVLPSLSGNVELTLKAHAPLNPKTDLLSWSLPLPKESAGNAAAQLAVGPATVVVLAADNISLSPQLDGSSIQQQPGPPSPALAARLAQFGPRQQKPLFYRVDSGSLSMANFSAKWMIRKQAVAVDAASEIRLWPEARKQIEVHQQFKYQVDNVPAQQVTLEIPRRLDELQTALQFRLDGVEVAPEKVADVRADDEAAMARRVQIKLPESGKIGSFLLTADYVLLQDQPQADSAHPYSVPLIVPVEAEIRSDDAQFAAAPGIRVAAVETPWLEIPRADLVSMSDALHYRADGSAAEIQFQSIAESVQTQGKTQISRAWLQTWLGESNRQDRAAYRFRSTQDHLEFKMPAGLKSADLRVMLDGKLAQAALTGGRLAISLKNMDLSSQEHTLELTYRFDGRMLARGQLVLETPTPQVGVWVDRTYWQLVLPHDKHLIVGPEELTPQYLWQWQGLFYGRQPFMEQAELESWVGAAREHALPDSTNRYLFSALATDGEFQLSVASRVVIVGSASLLALLGGLLLIYVPPLRHPGALVAIAVALLAAAVSYPELAVLFAQGATLGLGLALLATFLYRGVRRRQSRVVAVRHAPASGVERLSTELHAQPIGHGLRLGDSAATATMTLEIPASESHV